MKHSKNEDPNFLIPEPQAPTQKQSTARRPLYAGPSYFWKLPYIARFNLKPPPFIARFNIISFNACGKPLTWEAVPVFASHPPLKLSYRGFIGGIMRGYIGDCMGLYRMTKGFRWVATKDLNLITTI